MLRKFLLGAVLVAISGWMTSDAQAQLFRGRSYYRSGSSSSSNSNTRGTLPSTQPRYTTPSGSGPAYQRYSRLPYYMRAERKALGMFP